MKRMIAYGATIALVWAQQILSTAYAQSAQETVEQLNGEAMDAYHMMDVERAAELLERAIDTASQGPVSPEALAITHRNLGVVYIGALSDADGGQEQFVFGLCTDPSLELDPLTSTPQIKDAFQAAQAAVQSGACPSGSAAAQPASAGPSLAAQDQDYSDLPAVTQSFDEETPWDKLDRDEDEGPMSPFFFQLGLAIGASYVNHGMKADRPPPDNRVFAEEGAYVEDPIGRFLSYRQSLLTEEPLPEPRFTLPDETHFENLLNDWVPDGDSEDYLVVGGVSQPYLGVCPADGIPTGPQLAATDPSNLLPSSWCARVKTPGFIIAPALRANFGFFVTERFSLAAITRLQFSSGQGTLANLLLGARGEFLITQPLATGPMLSAFAGATFGQIQATVSEDENGPWVLTGPGGAHAGVSFRYRFHPNVGAFISPEVDLLFPATMFHIDIPLGVELAF